MYFGLLTQLCIGFLTNLTDTNTAVCYTFRSDQQYCTGRPDRKSNFYIYILQNKLTLYLD